MSIKLWSLLFAIVFVLVGIAGYLPQFTVDGKLLGIFEVHPMHNIIHIVTGIIAFIVFAKTQYAKLFFRVFGLIYAVVAILGFVRNGDLFIMHVNMADNILHIVIAIIALYLGFSAKK